MIINFKFVRTLNFSNLNLVFRNTKTQKRIIDAAIFLSAGAIIFSLATAYFEVKIEQLRGELDNSQSNFFILRTIRVSTELDLLFKLTYLDTQTFNYGDFNYDSLFSGWENELKSERRNDFFGYFRLNQANQMLMKLDLLNKEQEEKTLSQIKYFSDYRNRVETELDDLLSEREGKSLEEKKIDFYSDAQEINSENFEKFYAYVEFTYDNLSEVIEKERKLTLELRQQIKDLNWWSSNTFFIGFIAQIIIYLTFQLFELALERRKTNG